MRRTMFNNIRADVHRYNSNTLKGALIAISKLGFWAVVNYRVGSYLRARTRKIPLINFFIFIITGLSRLFINIITGIDISYSAKIDKGLKICHFSAIFISSKAVIGKNCTIHQGVTIGKGGHLNETREPVIKDDVFIGANSSVIGPVEIGNRVKIGANVCCYRSVIDDSTVVSNGMRVLIK